MNPPSNANDFIRVWCLLLKVMNPGLIGGLLLPILGSLPDALLIFASGSGGTLEEVLYLCEVVKLQNHRSLDISGNLL